MSRERIFHLADLIVKELDATEGVRVKAPDEVRPEIIRALTEESKFEESVDSEVRKTLVHLLAAHAGGQPGVGSALPEDPRGSVPSPVPPVTRLVVGITGASGSIYGIRLLEVLRATTELELHLVISAAGKRTLVEETDLSVSDVEALAHHRYDVRDIGAPLGLRLVPHRRHGDRAVLDQDRGGDRRLLRRHARLARGRRHPEGRPAAHPASCARRRCTSATCAC